MKDTKIKTLLQATAVLFAGMLLLGCPIDEADIFSGDVIVVNNTTVALDVTIYQTGAGPGTVLGTIAIADSATYPDYDCITSYTNTVTENGGVLTGSFSFIPPCGGTETVTWTGNPPIID